MEGEGALFPLGALQQSLRNFFVVTLHKGQEARDSRSPGRLRASLELVSPTGPLHGEAGSILPLFLRSATKATRSGDTWKTPPAAT